MLHMTFTFIGQGSSKAFQCKKTKKQQQSYWQNFKELKKMLKELKISTCNYMQSIT